MVFQNRGRSANGSRPSRTCIRPYSAQRLKVGITLPGLRSPFGSKASFTAAKAARSASENCTHIELIFSSPTPCSPVMVPPTAMHSSRISAPDQEELKKLAQTATGLTGYIIEVTGYADSSGSAAANTELSEDRAKAVITFLMQQGNVPVRHIVAPGAMGEYGAAASNETKAGRAENRRVDVKVLVNKGIAGN